MTRRAGWSAPALVAAGTGALAAFASGMAGPGSLCVALTAILIAHGRGAGWRISRWLEAPRLFAWLCAAYVPVFLADLGFSMFSSPVSALVRLVIFLLAADLLSGDPSRPTRPILFGLLLLVSSSGETTDIWFFAPLVTFAVAAVMAQMRATMLEKQPAGGSGTPRIRTAPVVAVVAGSLLLGGILFLAIPRIGTGWGRRPAEQGGARSLETGLADAVPLGTVGQVKKRRRMAFTATIQGGQVDPEAIYWRARAYSKWTGDGWIKEGREHETILDLPGGRSAWMPGEKPDPAWTGLVASIVMKLEQPPALLAPGRASWVRSPFSTRLTVGVDGSLSGSGGRLPRRYDVGVHPLSAGMLEMARPPGRRPGGRVPPAPGPAPGRGEAPARAGGPSGAHRPGSVAEGEDGGPVLPFWLDAGAQEPAVRDWAAGVAPGEGDPRRLAFAFVADLSRRPYSLDTSGIAPGHPIASFLAGAPAHCEFFASAMAIGLRLRGVPARVVSGYLGADTVPFSQTLVVRETRAHLWVEARIPGKGWVTFDPTPPEGRVIPSQWSYVLQGGWERIVLAWDGLIIGLDIQDQADMALWAKGAVISVLALAAQWKGWLALVLVLLVAGAAVGTWRGRRPGRVGKIRAAEIPHFYRRMLAIAERKGLYPGPAETSREFSTRAGASLGDAEAVRLVGRLYERDRFGGNPPDRSELARIEAALERLVRAAR